MCVILIGKIGMGLHEQAKRENPHGFSMYTQSMGLVKSPTDEQVRKGVKEFGIWHYRIASSGKIDGNNIHPFPVAHGSAYFYHNGVLGPGTTNLSDTNCLARTLYDAPFETVKSVLNALSTGQRFVLVSAKDPTKYLLYGDWKVEAGVLMSHTMYRSTAGWSGFARKNHNIIYHDTEKKDWYHGE